MKVKELILALLCESDLILSDDIVETIIDKVRVMCNNCQIIL